MHKPYRSNFLLFLLAAFGIAAFFSTGETTESPSVISKAQAAQNAASFLETQFGTRPSSSFVTFQSDTELSGYLQREKLTDSFNKRFGSYPIDYYQVELSLPASSKKYLINVNMRTGSVFGWIRLNAMPQPLNLKDLSEANTWLKAMGYDPKLFTLISGDGENAWIFENRHDQIGEATLRIRMEKSGGIISVFEPSFHLPETFITWMDRQTGAASFLSLISLLLSSLLAIAAIIAAVKYRKTASFERGALLTAFFIVIYAAYNINTYPGYKTASAGGPEGLLSVFFMQFTILLMAASVYISFVAGEALWLRSGWQPWPRWRGPDFGKHALDSMGRGYLLSLFILGVQSVVYYFAEQRFHIWTTEDPSSSIYNLLWPGLFPTLAWAAAISEEAVFRLFGIILFKKLFKNTFIAVLLSSFLWAMGHAGYPVYPVYTRLVEVTILGIIFGYAFLKYGLITVIFAHASMDSILMGLSIMDTDHPASLAGGTFYILSPAIVGLLIYWLHSLMKKRPRPLLPPEMIP
ncbi:CPBP family intramembrane glutamic endopeptidase [Ferviditalea candida]|uniref:CPBP family intramembrane glutamic endopeptidase n=1 Tax=Ferviditalea candida TaxID=3108399 RepID=A0ABU5ZD82_9BACL|nr:CPBP family intramembrane glutamic endopeptidase [Paenibacillaceae bacterium T2]